MFDFSNLTGIIGISNKDVQFLNVASISVIEEGICGAYLRFVQFSKVPGFTALKLPILYIPDGIVMFRASINEIQFVNYTPLKNSTEFFEVGASNGGITHH